LGQTQNCSLPAAQGGVVSRKKFLPVSPRPHSIWPTTSKEARMADSSPLKPEKSTELHAGVDVKKKTTRVNFVIVIAVLVFFALGIFTVVKVVRNPPQGPADTPLAPSR
jgi:hypothetical protein